MFDRKKIAAFMAGILICAGSAAAPCAAYADNEAETPATTAAAAAQGTYTKSGDFMYSLTPEGNACIEDYTGSAAELVVPDTLDGIPVKELGPTAFGSDHENNKLSVIELPASIDYISADNPFMYCTKLKEIKVSADSSDFCAADGILYNKDKDTLICYPCHKDGKSFTIPDTVKTLGMAAFYASELSDIKCPASLEKIGFFAFGDLYTMEKIDLSGTNVIDIESYAFSGCTMLKEITFPDTLEYIGGGAFARCKSLSEVTLPDSLMEIGQYAFADTGLKEIIIPDSVENIGYSAFGYYTDAATDEFVADENFTIVGSLNSAAQIYATDSDEDYDYQNSFSFLTPDEYQEQKDLLALDRVVSGDFEYAITSNGAVLTQCLSTSDKVTIPEELDGNRIVMIYPICFSTCSASEIILPESITEIREMSFYHCEQLRSITLPASVKVVGNNAFDHCSSLENIEILGAEKIGSSVFCDCTALKKVTVNGCLETWDGSEPFLYCTKLEEINVTEGSGNYSSQNGVLYNKDKTELIAYPVCKPDKEFTAPKSVKTIAMSAFNGAVYLESVSLPSVENINAYAFENCSKLSKVKFSKTLKNIESDAFYNCRSLESLRLPKSVENIGEYAFGFYHQDETDDNENASNDIMVNNFRVYAPKGSYAYRYAESLGVTVIPGTIELLGKNYDVRLLGFLGAMIAALIAILAGKGIARKAKKKKTEKELAEKAAKRRKGKEDDEDDEDDDEPDEDDDELDDDDLEEDEDEEEDESEEEEDEEDTDED